MRLVLVLALGGCQLVFQLEPAPDGPPDAPPDGPSCVMPASGFSSFDTPTNQPCDDVGFPNYDPQNVTQVIEFAPGELRWTPMPNLGNTRGGCLGVGPQSFGDGVFVEVSQPPTGPSEYLDFQVDWVGTNDFTVFSRFGSDLALFHHGSSDEMLETTPLDATARWWRIRPRADGLAVIGEVSPDGASWRTVATDHRTPPAMIRWELATGSVATEAAPTTTIIGSINACP